MRKSEFVKWMAVLAALVLLAAPASAGTFEIGIADPMASAIPAADVSALGLSIERRTVIWHGEDSFSGTIEPTPGLRVMLSVWAGYPVPVELPPADDEARARYCDFVLSIVQRYSQVSAVDVWNEPNLAALWGVGRDAYVDLLAYCAPRLHAVGVQAWAPALSPSTIPNVTAWATAIAARDPHLIDVWDQHEYDTGTPLAQKIAAIRAALGWNVPVVVGESQASLLGWVYCSGASGWLNYKLRDNGDWYPTGLENEDGSHKPTYDYVAQAAALIRAGQFDCSTPPPAPPPAPLTPFGGHRKQWICERLEEIGAWAYDAFLAS